MARPANVDDVETPRERGDRVADIVLAAEDVVAEVYRDPWTRRAWVAALLAKGEAESGNWAKAVHSGARTGDGGRARCVGQVHSSKLLPRAAWLATTGTSREATRRCWRAVLRYLRGAMGHCRGGLNVDGFARAYALYGTGDSCEPTSWSRRRAQRWAYLVERANRANLTR